MQYVFDTCINVVLFFSFGFIDFRSIAGHSTVKLMRPIDHFLSKGEAVTVYIWNENQSTGARAYITRAKEIFPEGDAEFCVSTDPALRNGQWLNSRRVIRYQHS